MNEIVKIGTLGDIFIGLTYQPEDVSDEGTVVLRSSNIQNGRLDFNDTVRVNCSVRDNLFVKKNDILMCSRNGSAKLVGKCTILPELDEKMTFGAFMTIIRTEHNPYLVHFFNSNAFRRQLGSSATTTINQITRRMLDSIDVPVYPEGQEQQIVELFDNIDSLIHNQYEQLECLDELIKSRFVELFGEPFLNPKEWEMSKIGDVVTEVRYGTSRPAVEGGKYPYLRMNNLTVDGHLDLTDLKYIDIPDNEIEKCIVRKGDVLFNRTNSVELVGKTCVFDLDEEMVIAGYIIRVRLNDRVLPEFLSAYMNSAILKEHLRGMAKGAVNQANINAQEMQGIKIYLPPIELQQQFAEFVKQVENAKAVIKEQLAELETLKKSLMQKYFG